MRIDIIGPFPPPIGGIANHCERLFLLLKKNDFDVKFYDDFLLPRTFWLVKLLNKLKKKGTSDIYSRDRKVPDKNYILLTNFYSAFFKLVFLERNVKKIVHYHKKSWNSRAILCLAAKLNPSLRIVLSVHSLREDLNKLGFTEKFFMKFTVKNAHFFIVMNDVIKAKLIEAGCSFGKIEIIPAFLPPEEKESDFSEIPGEVWDFIESRSPVLSANAFMIRFFNNEDLYGIDLCIELCGMLKEHFPQIGFVFSLPNIGDDKYFEKMNQLIEKKTLRDNFLFITKPYAFYPILKKSDVFIRPTNTDGDALSIRESLFYNVPTIASNVIARPEGTVLFENRDINDLYSKTKEILENRNATTGDLCDSGNKNNLERTIKVFESVMDR